MTARLAAASLTLALLAGTVFGQSPPTQDERPPEKPPQADGAAAPPERPANPVEAAPPAERPAASPAKPPPDRPDSASDAGPEADSPSADDKGPPAGPEAPPIPETLRESDPAYRTCLLALYDLGTVYEVLPRISQPDQRDCGIARPLRVTEILPGIALQGGAVMRCDTARALGLWMRDFVRPAAARLPDAPRLSGLQLGSTYDCRGRVGDKVRAKLSEHAFGNAIDITAFTFQDRPPRPVAPRQDSGDLAEAFQRAVRGAACLEFATVLGPGSNASHDDHLHLDIAARKGGWRLCQ